MSNEQAEVMGTREAAKILGVSVRTAQLWVENGSLKAWKTPGKHRRILRSSVEALLAERSGSTTPTGTHDDILIVEDEATMQAYYQALFELLRPDVSIRFANDGFAGLVEFGRQQPRLMLVDIDMPGMDGIEMIKALDANVGSEVAIVVVTGLSLEQVSARGGVPDDVPVFSKPLSADGLQDILQQSNMTDASEGGAAQ